MKNKYKYHFWTLFSCTTMDFWYRSKGLFIASVKKLFGCSQGHVCTARMSGHPTWTNFTVPQFIIHNGLCKSISEIPDCRHWCQVIRPSSLIKISSLWMSSSVRNADRRPLHSSSRFKEINQLIHLSLIHGSCSILSNIELNLFPPQIITMI